MRNSLDRLLRDTAYTVSALALGIASFVLAVVGLAVGAGLLFTVVGAFVLAATAYAARGLARVERARIGWVQGAEVPRPAYRVAGDGDGWLRRVTTPLRDARSWREVLWALLSFVTGTTVAVVTVVWWAVAGGGLTYWLWQVWLPDGEDNGLAELLGLGDSRTTESLLMLTIGLAAAVTLPFVVRACAALHAGLGNALLGPARPADATLRTPPTAQASAA